MLFLKTDDSVWLNLAEAQSQNQPMLISDYPIKFIQKYPLAPPIKITDQCLRRHFMTKKAKILNKKSSKTMTEMATGTLASIPSVWRNLFGHR